MKSIARDNVFFFLRRTSLKSVRRFIYNSEAAVSITNPIKTDAVQWRFELFFHISTDRPPKLFRIINLFPLSTLRSLELLRAVPMRYNSTKCSSRIPHLVSVIAIVAGYSDKFLHPCLASHLYTGNSSSVLDTSNHVDRDYSPSKSQMCMKSIWGNGYSSWSSVKKYAMHSRGRTLENGVIIADSFGLLNYRELYVLLLLT